ncbi:MAG: glycosyltransferase family 39 protein [Blastocatellia bacterium]
MVAGVKAETDQRSSVLNKRLFRLSEMISPLLTLAAGLICYGLFFNRGLGLAVIGYSIAPAERVMQGEVPYRDFLFNYTPGILWVNAALMKAFGTTLLTTRVGLVAFKLVTLLTLFYVSRRLTNAWAALVPVLLTLAWLGYQQPFNVFPDQYLMLFALVSLICLLNYDDTERHRWLLLCGLGTGAVFLFKHNVGVLLFATAAAAIVMRELMTSRRLTNAARASALFLLGFAVVIAALAIYLFYNHALGAMVGHFLHHAAEYSEARSVGLPSPDLVLITSVMSLVAIAAGVFVLVVVKRGFQLYVLAAIAVGTIIMLLAKRGDAFNESLLASVAYFPPFVFAFASALAVWQLKRKERDPASWWRRNGATVTVGLVALAVYLEVFPRADYYHLVRVLPPVFMFLFVLVARCVPVLTEQLRHWIRSPGQAALLVLSAPFVFLVAIGVNNTWAPEFDSGLHFRDNRELTIERGRGIFVEERPAELTEGLVNLIQSNSSADEYIFSFAQRGSGLYFLAGRRNPTRFLWWRSVGISGEEREAVMTMIGNRRAKLIIIQDIAATREIQDFIGENYDHIGTVADIAVYGARKPAGDAASDKRSVN